MMLILSILLIFFSINVSVNGSVNGISTRKYHRSFTHPTVPKLFDSEHECEVEVTCHNDNCAVLLTEYSLNAMNKLKHQHKTIDWEDVEKHNNDLFQQPEAFANSIFNDRNDEDDGNDGNDEDDGNDGNDKDDKDDVARVNSSVSSSRSRSTRTFVRSPVKCPRRGHHISCHTTAYCVKVGVDRYGYQPDTGNCYLDIYSHRTNQIIHRNTFNR